MVEINYIHVSGTLDHKILADVQGLYQRTIMDANERFRKPDGSRSYTKSQIDAAVQAFHPNRARDWNIPLFGLLAYGGNRLIGSGFLRIKELDVEGRIKRTQYFYAYYVDPNYRRGRTVARTIGKALLAKAREVAQKSDNPALKKLRGLATDFDRVLNLYKRAGAKDLGIITGEVAPGVPIQFHELEFDLTK